MSAEIVFKVPVTLLAVCAVESAQTIFKAPVTLAPTPWLCSSYYPAKETAGRMQPDQEINNNKNDSKKITSGWGVGGGGGGGGEGDVGEGEGGGGGGGELRTESQEPEQARTGVVTWAQCQYWQWKSPARNARSRRGQQAKPLSRPAPCAATGPHSDTRCLPAGGSLHLHLDLDLDLGLQVRLGTVWRHADCMHGACAATLHTLQRTHRLLTYLPSCLPTYLPI